MERRISVRQARSLRSFSLISQVRETPALAVLARQFVVVNDRETWPILNRSPEKFLEGHNPLWEDIRNARDVQLGIVPEIVEQARSFFERASPIAAACGISIRSPIVFRAVRSADTKSMFSELSAGSMRALVEWFDQEFVRPRHRVVGEETVRRCMDRYPQRDRGALKSPTAAIAPPLRGLVQRVYRLSRLPRIF
jgi:hypothetical protein